MATTALHSDQPARSPHTRRCRALALVLLLAAALPGHVRVAGAAEPDRAVLDTIPAKMQEFVKQGQIAGAVTVVGRHDGIVSFEAVGWRDLETRQPMTKETVFRIASMTKPITAIGVMILADEGKLAVEDEVEKHLPEFRGQMLLASRTPELVTLKRPSRKITIRDLLTHTSGLPGGMPPGLSDIYVRRNHTLAEVVMAVSQRPLNFEPGSKWSYCNAGMGVLGRVIEVASGQRYEEFLKRRIFDPLGMKDTAFYPSAEQLGRRAQTYGIKEGKLVAVPDTIIGPTRGAVYPIPAGGLHSTGADLARLYEMMLCRGSCQGKRILSEKAVKRMTSLQTGELKVGFVAEMGFGLGWGVVRQPAGVTAMLSPGTFGHGGAFGTQGWIDPKQDLFMVLLIQRVGLRNGDASDMRRVLQAVAVSALKSGK